MSELARRRRALMGQNKAETWDYNWDYSMGLLEAQGGWTVDKSASGAYSEMTDAGEVIHAPSGKYYQIIRSNNEPYQYLQNGIGVLEIKGIANLSYGGTDQWNFMISVGGNSTDQRITIYPQIASNNTGKWRMRTNTNVPANGTAFADYQNGAFMLRIEMDGTSADIYINGSLVGKNLSLSTSVAGGKTQIYCNRLYSGTLTLKSLKIKSGRL